MPKEIPDHILDGIELPSAPTGGPRKAPQQTPVTNASARRSPSVRPPDLGPAESRPSSAPRPRPSSARRPGEMLPATPRRPGEREASKRTGSDNTSQNLLSGAELFQKGAELPAIGEFAGYTVLGRLAIGGMAEILLARQPGQEEPIVLKKILATFDSDDEFVEMFLDEARVGMQLEHPNIGRFLDAGEERGRYFIAMEWVNGVTLAKLVRRARKSGGIPPVMAGEIVRAIADALHYAHTSRDENGDLMGLIHRDVSPHNIMIGYDGTVKLLDFGIAKAMGAAHITAAGVVKGKFAYMAPEQCEGETIDFRSDIFALGVVLFEALTGERLFRRGSDRETVRAIVREPVPALSDHWPQAPRELEAICSTALDKDPTARFPTAASMRDVLTLFIEGQGDDVSQQRVAELVQSIFASELRDGPNVDPALSELDPVSYSVSNIQESSAAGPPPLSSPSLDPTTGTQSRVENKARRDQTPTATQSRVESKAPYRDSSPGTVTGTRTGRTDARAMSGDASGAKPCVDSLAPFFARSPADGVPPADTSESARESLDHLFDEPADAGHTLDHLFDEPADAGHTLDHLFDEPADTGHNDSPPPASKTQEHFETSPFETSPFDRPEAVSRSSSALPAGAPLGTQSPDHVPRRDETPTRFHHFPPAEIEHEWSDEHTAIQNATARDEVLRQIQVDRARESNEWPAAAEAVGYDVQVEVGALPEAADAVGGRPDEPKRGLSTAEPAPAPPKSKLGLAIGVLIALSAAAGLVWFFVLRA